MITLKFYRFVLEPRTVREVFKTPRTISTAEYQIKFDHEVNQTNDQCTLERALKVAHVFLKDHYGHVRIIFESNDEFAKTRVIKISNKHKFYLDMINNNVVVSLHKTKIGR